MKRRKRNDEWQELIIYGLLATTLIGLSICLIIMSGNLDKLFALN